MPEGEGAADNEGAIPEGEGAADDEGAIEATEVDLAGIESVSSEHKKIRADSA